MRGPDMTTPEGRAGLTARLAERECICTAADNPNDHRPDCPLWRIDTLSPEEAGRMNESDGLGR